MNSQAHDRELLVLWHEELFMRSSYKLHVGGV